MNNKTYALCTKSEEATFRLGAQLALLPCTVICLVGNLGSGKTILSKGYAKGLGITEHITSPTFTIINQYEYDQQLFHHMDAYRIDDEEMLYDIGFFELFEQSKVVIEWADNIKNSIPKGAIWITIEKDDTNESIRYFIIEGSKKQIETIGGLRLC